MAIDEWATKYMLIDAAHDVLGDVELLFVVTNLDLSHHNSLCEEKVAAFGAREGF